MRIWFDTLETVSVFRFEAFIRFIKMSLFHGLMSSIIVVEQKLVTDFELLIKTNYAFEKRMKLK